jgi:predicted RNA-binding protein YlqC (UPF0109 family)
VAPPTRANNRAEPDIIGLVDYMARAIVDHPDEVDVREEIEGHQHYFVLSVADDDKGKVIGKHGRIANSMRSLVKVGAMVSDIRATLEIED